MADKDRDNEGVEEPAAKLGGGQDGGKGAKLGDGDGHGGRPASCKHASQGADKGVGGNLAEEGQNNGKRPGDACRIWLRRVVAAEVEFAVHAPRGGAALEVVALAAAGDCTRRCRWRVLTAVLQLLLQHIDLLLHLCAREMVGTTSLVPPMASTRRRTLDFVTRCRANRRGNCASCAVNRSSLFHPGGLGPTQIAGGQRARVLLTSSNLFEGGLVLGRARLLRLRSQTLEECTALLEDRVPSARGPSGGCGGGCPQGQCAVWSPGRRRGWAPRCGPDTTAHRFVDKGSLSRRKFRGRSRQTPGKEKKTQKPLFWCIFVPFGYFFNIKESQLFKTPRR